MPLTESEKAQAEAEARMSALLAAGCACGQPAVALAKRGNFVALCKECYLETY